MPKKYTDEEGNEIELLTPEEQQAEIDKKAAELAASKKEEKKEEEKKDTPSIEEIDKTLKSVTQSLQKEREEQLNEWFEDTISQVIDDEDTKKKVRQNFDLLRTNGRSNKEALSDALLLVKRSDVSPFNGVLRYNKSSGVPGSKNVDTEAEKMKQKFSGNLPPGFRLSK